MTVRTDDPGLVMLNLAPSDRRTRSPSAPRVGKPKEGHYLHQEAAAEILGLPRAAHGSRAPTFPNARL